MITIIRRPRIETIDCALMENEQTGDVVVCMPEQDITAAGAEALGATLTSWMEGRAFLAQSWPLLAANQGHV